MFLYYTEERRTYSSCKPATGGEERRGERRGEGAGVGGVRSPRVPCMLEQNAR